MKELGLLLIFGIKSKSLLSQKRENECNHCGSNQTNKNKKWINPGFEIIHSNCAGKQTDTEVCFSQAELFFLSFLLNLLADVWNEMKTEDRNETPAAIERNEWLVGA